MKAEEKIRINIAAVIKIDKAVADLSMRAVIVDGLPYININSIGLYLTKLDIGEFMELMGFSDCYCHEKFAKYVNTIDLDLFTIYFKDIHNISSSDNEIESESIMIIATQKGYEYLTNLTEEYEKFLENDRLYYEQHYMGYDSI